MVSKLDLQTYTNEFESHWVSHSYGLVLHLCKKLCKLGAQIKHILGLAQGHMYMPLSEDRILFLVVMD